MPTSAEALFEKAKSLFDAQDYEAAAQTFAELVAAASQVASFHAWYGRSLCNKGDANGAIVEAERALQLDRTCALAHLVRGNARHEKGDQDGAIADYSEAIRLDPKDATVLPPPGNYP